jgi:hypothetical protein
LITAQGRDVVAGSLDDGDGGVGDPAISEVGAARSALDYRSYGFFRRRHG